MAAPCIGLHRTSSGKWVQGGPVLATVLSDLRALGWLAVQYRSPLRVDGVVDRPRTGSPVLALCPDLHRLALDLLYRFCLWLRPCPDEAFQGPCLATAPASQSARQNMKW